MKKNRKMTKRMSRVASASWRFGSIIIVLFVMVILNLLAMSSCQQIAKSIGDNEKLLGKLENEVRQESTRWELLKTPEKLETALRGHGLKMLPAHPNQNIRMKSNGTPYPCNALAIIAKRRQPVAINETHKTRRTIR